MEQEKSATLTNLFGGVEKDYNAYMFCGWLLLTLKKGRVADGANTVLYLAEGPSPDEAISRNCSG